MKFDKKLLGRIMQVAFGLFRDLLVILFNLILFFGAISAMLMFIKTQPKLASIILPGFNSLFKIIWILTLICVFIVCISAYAYFWWGVMEWIVKKRKEKREKFMNDLTKRIVKKVKK